ncbi:luc7-like protein 3 [Coccinella septempunctata]|uniref:luc7-like protein 3 n=1 Tax=Coccinella septempunctata TaxID=41139 RepID=UPI001D07797B|nr:luc7-like protein 3 [Coccinella septempunctata]
MAVLAAAQLLDELMGRNRNVAPNEKKREPNWEDPEYCPYFLVKFCPHDLFVNTRADLGACSKVHDEEVRKLYDQAKPARKLHYQEEFVRFCSAMINDVQRKIQKGKNRLALSGKAESPATVPNQSHKNQEKIDILNERINGLEAEAEKAGTDGNVEQAQGLMMLCDKLKDERDALKKQMESGHWSVELAQAQEKQMEVCEVCGAFLIVGDAQQRLDDHLSGKQHLGFSKLKAAIAELTEIIHEVKNERRSGRGLSSIDEGSRDRDKRRERSRERNRSEHRNRDERKRSRSKDREREKERDKDKQRRERGRSERRDRDKDKKHRLDRDHERRHHHHRR